MAGKVKFTVYQGSTFKKSFIYKKTTPVDLTGCKIFLKIAPTTLPALEYSTETGHIIIPDPTEGKFIITITDEETTTYVWSSAKYNLHIEFPNGEVYRLLEGTFKVSRKV